VLEGGERGSHHAASATLLIQPPGLSRQPLGSAEGGEPLESTAELALNRHAFIINVIVNLIIERLFNNCSDSEEELPISTDCSEVT